MRVSEWNNFAHEIILLQLDAKFLRNQRFAKKGTQKALAAAVKK